MPTSTYEFDPQCRNANNIVTKDITIPVRDPNLWYYYVIPEGVIFTRDFRVEIDATNEVEVNFKSGLVEAVMEYKDGTHNLGESVFGAIALPPGIQGTIKLQYHVLGGNFKPDLKGVIDPKGFDTLARLQNLDWSQVSNVPATWPPTPHNQPLSSIQGISDVLASLNSLKSVIENGHKTIRLDDIDDLSTGFMSPLLKELSGIKSRLVLKNQAEQANPNLQGDVIIPLHVDFNKRTVASPTAQAWWFDALAADGKPTAANTNAIQPMPCSIVLGQNDTSFFTNEINLSTDTALWTKYKDKIFQIAGSGYDGKYVNKDTFGYGRLLPDLIIDKPGRYLIRYNPKLSIKNISARSDNAKNTLMSYAKPSMMAVIDDLLLHREVKTFMESKITAGNKVPDPKAALGYSSYLVGEFMEAVYDANSGDYGISTLGNDPNNPYNNSWEQVHTLTQADVDNGKALIVNFGVHINLNTDDQAVAPRFVVQPFVNPLMMRGRLGKNWQMVTEEGGLTTATWIRLGDA